MTGKEWMHDLSDKYAPTRPQSINLRTISMDKYAASQDQHKEIKYNHPNIISDSNLDNHVSLSRHNHSLRFENFETIVLVCKRLQQRRQRRVIAAQNLKSLHSENERDLGDGL